MPLRLLLLLLCLAGMAQGAETAPSPSPHAALLQPRVLVERRDGQLRYTYLAATDFASAEALRRSLDQGVALAGGQLVVQFEDGVTEKDLTDLIAQLAAAGWTNLALAPPPGYRALGEQFLHFDAKHPEMIVFNGALSDAYAHAFGAQGPRFLALDLEHALRIGQIGVATNLLLSLPPVLRPGGGESPFRQLPAGMQLSDQALRAWMAAAADPTMPVEERRMLLFFFGWLDERRAVAFLIGCMQQPWSLWEHSGEMEALTCLRWHDQILAQGTLLMSPYPGDGPQLQAQFARDRATMTAWFAQTRNQLPPQVLPPSPPGSR